MSYLPYHPSQLGVFIPEDPRRRFAPMVERAFVFDQVSQLVVTMPGGAARHPVESAEDAPTDAILHEPTEVALTVELVDKPLNVGLYPLPVPAVRPDRALNRAAEFARLRDRKTLFTVVLPGFVLAHRAVGNLTISPAPDEARVSLQMTLERVQLVDLRTQPVVADSDSVALGAQKVEHVYVPHVR